MATLSGGDVNAPNWVRQGRGRASAVSAKGGGVYNVLHYSQYVCRLGIYRISNPKKVENPPI